MTETDLRERSADLADVRPGPRLASMLDACGLQTRETAGLAEHDLIEALRAAHRMGAWSAALELAAISELDRRRTARARERGDSAALAAEFVIDEVAAALAMTDSAAAIRAAVAHRLSGPLAETFEDGGSSTSGPESCSGSPPPGSGT